MPYQVKHFIDGNLTNGEANQPNPLINPATGEHQGDVFYGTKRDVSQAVLSAKNAFPQWSQTTLTQRADIMFKFKELIERHSDELAQMIVNEHGKTVADARGSLQRGLEVVKFACGISDHLKTTFYSRVSQEIDGYAIRQPLGVCVGITPFNFPAMIPLWMFPIAVACGNCFVMKPSEKDPSCPLRLAELAHEAGLPAGVLNVIQGDQVVVDELLTHPDVAAVSFVGSSKVAQYVQQTAIAHHKRVQAFGGAKNHAVLMPDADLDLAVNQLLGAAFGSAGERCMAISVVVAVGDRTADEFVQALAPKLAEITIGPGTEDVAMGPLVTRQHLDTVKQYIAQGVNEGAELVVDGRQRKFDQFANGHFLGASLFDHVTSEMRIYQEEIFGPVLSVVRVKDYAEAVQLVSQHAYGNGTAIFTQDPDVARHYVNDVKVGMVGVNVPIPVPAAQFSFGGWKNSIFADLHMHGPEGVQFYTRLKNVTQRWPRTHSEPEYQMPTLGN